MKAKKNPNIDYDQWWKKRLLQLAGVAIVFGFVLAIISWKNFDDASYDYGQLNIAAVDQQIPPITRPEQPIKPPPPPPKPKPKPKTPKFEEVKKEDPPPVEEDIADDEDPPLDDLEGLEDEGEEPVPMEAFAFVEDMPYVESCKDAGTSMERDQCTRLFIRNYLRDKIDVPQFIVDAGVNVRVMIFYEISATGEITNIKVKERKGGNINSSLEKNVVTATKSIPKMVPGKQRGKAVTVKHSIPISFKFE